MNETRQQYLSQPDKYKSLVWDYNLQPRDFFVILDGDAKKGWFDREWATARVLENANYYDAIALVDMDYLSKQWGQIKRRLFKPDIKHGYEYLLRKRALSTAK